MFYFKENSGLLNLSVKEKVNSWKFSNFFKILRDEFRYQWVIVISIKFSEIIKSKSDYLGLSNYIDAKKYDLRQKLNFKDNSFDGCYSHMLYCMAFSMNEIISLNNEVLRILKKGGINIFTVRNTLDGDYKNGIHRDEGLYENDGFIVHFFSIEKIKKLLNGFELIKIDNFNEGKFPRKLYKVVLKKL